jgi:hypothetical protein
MCLNTGAENRPRTMSVLPGYKKLSSNYLAENFYMRMEYTKNENYFRLYHKDGRPVDGSGMGRPDVITCLQLKGDKSPAENGLSGTWIKTGSIDGNLLWIKAA